jgi:hypothetical protein
MRTLDILKFAGWAERKRAHHAKGASLMNGAHGACALCPTNLDCFVASLLAMTVEALSEI